MKFISPVALVLALCISAAAQVVTIESKEEVYTRPKPIQDFKKQFTVTRPIAKTSDRARAKKITEAISPEAMLDFDLERERDEVQWVEETGYDVLYNDRGVLAIRLWMYGSAAYPDDVSRTTVIDLSTGDRVYAENVFADLKGLAKLLNAAQKTEIKEAVAVMKANPDYSDLDPNELFRPYDLSAENIEEFSVDADGVTFYYNYAFPHVVKALEPEGKYTFTWEEMKPFIRRDGLLARFIS